MNRHVRLGARSLICCIALILTASCGGGGGGGDGGVDEGISTLLSITASGVGTPLWQFVQGTPVTPPQCPSPVFLNSSIVFTFGGLVDPSSIPSTGLAQGSINITSTASNPPITASGFFTVTDDPSLPVGNARRVTFRPTPPSDPNQPTTAGLNGNLRYDIFVPRTGSSAQVVNVAGTGLTTEALTCIQTCDAAALQQACFTDPTIGPPFVTSTTPTTNDPSPTPVNPAQVTGNTISIFFSEPLFPQNIDNSQIVVRTAAGAQVPGDVVFYQAGSPQAGPIGARIDYIASSQLLSSTTYEITISNLVRDFGSNPVALYDPSNPTAPASGRRFFVTTTVPFCDQPPIVESFDNPNNRASTSGVAQWASTGQVITTFPSAIIGNGAFGALTFPNPGPASLDPGQATIINGGQVAFQNGVWNTTTVSVVAGANVRCTGHTTGNLRQVHLRALNTVDILGTLNANAGTSTTAPIGDTEQGARVGQFNNGNPGQPQAVAGGVGGSGGGAGGRASQADPTPPTAIRTPAGEIGFGPPASGLVNTGSGAGATSFGGGAGGVGGFQFPQGGVAGEVGGLGAAGGSAFASGGNGGPTTPLPACAPANNPVQARALATGQTPAFVPPILVQAAGSGGGGGGDRFEVAGPASDDQGGGGGGGGGGIRISSIGNIALGAAAAITCNGAPGGAGNVFNGGAGAGGSGGQIWLQSFGAINIATTTTMTVNGGTSPTPCGNQSAGAGGVGLIQLEAGVGTPITNFTGAPTVPGAVRVEPFPFSTNVTGTAISTFFDTGYGDPVFVSASEVTNIIQVTAPNPTIQILYEGAFENVTGGGPNLGTLSPPTPGSNITALNGYRFIRFRINFSYQSPPASQITNVFPIVDSVSIAYRAPVNCTTTTP